MAGTNHSNTIPLARDSVAITPAIDAARMAHLFSGQYASATAAVVAARPFMKNDICQPQLQFSHCAIENIMTEAATLNGPERPPTDFPKSTHRRDSETTASATFA